MMMTQFCVVCNEDIGLSEFRKPDGTFGLMECYRHELDHLNERAERLRKDLMNIDDFYSVYKFMPREDNYPLLHSLTSKYRLKFSYNITSCSGLYYYPNNKMICLVLEHKIFTEIMKDLVGNIKLEKHEYLPILKTFQDLNKSELRFKHTLKLICDNLVAHCKGNLQDSCITNGGLELCVGFGRRMNSKLGTRLYELISHNAIMEVVNTGSINNIEQALAIKSYCRFLGRLGKQNYTLKRTLINLKYDQKSPTKEECFGNYNKLVRLYNSLKVERSCDVLNRTIIGNKQGLMDLYGDKEVALKICVEYKNQRVDSCDRMQVKKFPFTLKDIHKKFMNFNLLYGIYVNTKKLNKNESSVLTYTVTISDNNTTKIVYSEYLS
jgi:hypothetical protein